AAVAALAVHTMVVLQPSLDPSAAPVLSALIMAALVLPFTAQKATLKPWMAWVSVATLSALLALLLPHSVGLTRLVTTTTSAAFGPTWSPSIGTALFAATIGVGFGAAVGSVVGGARVLPERAIAIAAGLFVGVSEVNGAGVAPVALAAGFTGIAALLAPSRIVQASGLLPGTLAAVAIWRGTALPIDLLVLSPLDGLRSAERWTAHLDRSVALSAGGARLDGHSVGAVLAAPEDWGVASQTLDTLPFIADVGGRFTRPSGRAAEAEVLAGLLAGMLAPRLDRIVVLGDDGGNALAGLADSSPTTIDIATPTPTIIQDIALLAPSRRSRWLGPGVRLWPEHPDSVLRRTARPAAVVDISHAAWSDANHAAPTDAHFAAVRSALDDYGVYVLCLHLDHFASGAPAHLARRVAAHFESVQVWLPPTGADSLLLVASGHSLPLSRLEKRTADQRTTMRQLGFPNGLALASMAVGDRDTLVAWRSGANPEPRQWWLSTAVRGPIELHLASLAPHLAPAERIWSLDDAEIGAAALTSRLDTRRRFLELLDDAARGDVAGALDKARGLATDDGGERALRALVGPHIENAQKALEIAVKEGPGSAAWADVNRFATTARMIAPTSSEPLVLLGTMALAQGDLNGAQSHFAEAEKMADGDLEALTGLARVARLRRDTVSAERYFREAAAANPRQWLAWHRLGVFLTETGRIEEAETTLERAAGRAEGRSAAPNLALARLYLQTERPTPALVHAERAIVMGDSAEAYFLRGLAYRDLEQLDNAERDFRQTVLSDPTFAPAHGELGRIRAVRGDPAAAEEAWRAVLRIDPDNRSARENLRRLGIEDRAAGSAPPE
ncbi:MAG TPA: hypothetical protein DFR83_18965, partial [Deltaproteobacteria bacterium]|nr:hypothetical protein [Deltaproteobacteria bacterium]